MDVYFLTEEQAAQRAGGEATPVRQATSPQVSRLPDVPPARASLPVDESRTAEDAAPSTQGAGGEARRDAAGPEFTAYLRQLLAHIRPFQRYPDAAYQGRLAGTVQVGFLLRRDGTVEEIWIETSSGHAILDQAAVDTIRRAEPLPPVPARLPAFVDVFLPVAFVVPDGKQHG